MKCSFCVYKGVKYDSFIEFDKKVRLLVCERQKGFHHLVENWKINKDIFCKDVSKKKLDELYTIDYKVRYQGGVCDLMCMDASILERGYISIVTDNVEFAKKYDFRRFDVLDYIKDVSVDEINKLLIEENDLLSKQSGPKRKEVNLMEYLKSL